MGARCGPNRRCSTPSRQPRVSCTTSSISRDSTTRWEADRPRPAVLHGAADRRRRRPVVVAPNRAGSLGAFRRGSRRHRRRRRVPGPPHPAQSPECDQHGSVLPDGEHVGEREQLVLRPGRGAAAVAALRLGVRRLGPRQGRPQDRGVGRRVAGRRDRVRGDAQLHALRRTLLHRAGGPRHAPGRSRLPAAGARARRSPCSASPRLILVHAFNEAKPIGLAGTQPIWSLTRADALALERPAMRTVLQTRRTTGARKRARGPRPRRQRLELPVLRRAARPHRHISRPHQHPHRSSRQSPLVAHRAQPPWHWRIIRTDQAG